MSAFTLIFEIGVAGLMAALIVYCIRLDRRLRALRESDSAIHKMIGELRAAADRAEAAVSALKTAGIEAERSLNQAIRTAQAVEDDLIRRGRGLPTAASPTPPGPAAPATPQPASERGGMRRAVREPEPSSQDRSAAERDLLRAIRIARAAGGE